MKTRSFLAVPYILLSGLPGVLSAPGMAAPVKGGEKVPAGFHDGIYRAADIALKPYGTKPRRYFIKAWVTMDGVTRTRSRVVTIVP